MGNIQESASYQEVERFRSKDQHGTPPRSFKELVEILRSPEINLAALKSGAKKHSASSSAVEKKVFIKIDKVQITDSSVSFKYKWCFGFALPDYTRQDIGKDGNLTPDQLAAEIYKFHLKEMQLKAIRKLEEIKQASEGTLKDLMDRIKEKYGKKKEREIAKSNTASGNSSPFLVGMFPTGRGDHIC